MNFKDEFKKEMQTISPTDKQVERIGKGVMKRLAESSDNTSPVPHRKKPLYLRIAAVSGTAVCAAAIMIFAFMGIRNNAIKNGDMSPDAGNANLYSSSVADGSDGRPDHDYCSGSNAEINSLGGGSATNSSIKDVFPSVENSKDSTSTYVEDIRSHQSVTDSGNTGNSMDDNIPTGGGDDNPNTAGGGTDDNPDTAGSENADTGGGNTDTGGGDTSANTTPQLNFFNDGRICEISANGSTQVYRLTDDTAEFSDEKAVWANADSGQGFLVQLEKDRAAVFYKNGSLLGVYIKQ